jgi:NAD(P)-dependent dehydrogenase (short-subunit alcohol dehydrogenase family)
MRDIRGKTAIVTGAASGIGLGIAKALAHAGANIVLADLRPEALKSALLLVPWRRTSLVAVCCKRSRTMSSTS